MNNIAFIDIEASGLHFDSYPIEIAVLKGDEIRSWLIKPETTWQYWSEVAEQMHDISREILIKDGISCNTVVDQLNEFLLDFDGVLYSDAYQWDIDWIDTLYFSVKQKRPFHIASVYDLLPDQKSKQFDELKLALAESGRYRKHRARDDVGIIAEAFFSVLSSSRA